MQDELFGALDVKFLLGLEAEAGPLNIGGTLYKNVSTGDTGGQGSVQVGIGLLADRPTPPGGSITGGAEPAQVSFMAGPYQKNLTTGESSFSWDKLLKFGGAIGIGGSVEFNPKTFNQIHRQNEACREKGGG